MGKWGKYRALSRLQRSLLHEAIVLLPLYALLVRIFGVRRWVSGHGDASGTSSEAASVAGHPGALDYATEAARMVAAAARHSPFGASCLNQSIALQHMLRRRGIETELRIGARKSDGRLKAHAWLELMDRPLNQAEDVRGLFTPFEKPGAAAVSTRRTGQVDPTDGSAPGGGP
jgi:hypothetical protein